MGGPSRPLMKPRWLGGPIEARGFDEIVDFMVALLNSAALLPTKQLTRTPLWTAIFLETVGQLLHVSRCTRLGKICVRRVTFG